MEIIEEMKDRTRMPRRRARKRVKGSTRYERNCISTAGLEGAMRLLSK